MISNIQQRGNVVMTKIFVVALVLGLLAACKIFDDPSVVYLPQDPSCVSVSVHGSNAQQAMQIPLKDPGDNGSTIGYALIFTESKEACEALLSEFLLMPIY